VFPGQGLRTRRALGRAGWCLARTSCLRGRRGLRGQGCLRAYVCRAAGRFAVALRPQTGLTPEGRPRTSRGASPGLERGSPMVKDSGGEAASFWSWAAQRPARGHAGSFPASDRS